MTIKKAAVLGAGTMGSQIAAHITNAGAEVVLLDIVPDDVEGDRSKLAEDAINKMLEGGKAFTDPANAGKLTSGNFEDDMEKLSECDWIIEAIIEDQDIKRDLYKQVDAHRKTGSIVSSNTSTIPLKKLKEDQTTQLKEDLIITHFFNPPRQMRLLELVCHKIDADNDNNIQALKEFIDKKMGKSIVPVKDTPGFIGNRIGLYWMLTGLQQALKKNTPISVADEVMSNIGFPKTGIFGLFDLVGVNLMHELGRSLCDQLPQEDGYQSLDRAIEFLGEMDESFYKKEDGKRLSLNLHTFQYEAPPAQRVEEELSMSGILLKKTDEVEYARAVLLRTLNYACTALPEIANNVHDVDTAMKNGFGWSRGPFEMIDDIGVKALIDAVEKENMVASHVLQHARTEGFYKEKKGNLYALKAKDGFQRILYSEEKWKLHDKVRGAEPVLESDVAKLWDIGDGIACLELTTKMDTMGPHIFDFITEVIETVKNDFKGLIIGDDDKHFSAGLNLNLILMACEQEDWNKISEIIKYGQRTMLALKYAPFPVVTAISGKALGGACEMALHSDAIQAHIESYIGLVEVNIGVVPAWGGCKEMLIRHAVNNTDAATRLQGSEDVFDMISSAKISSSAEEFRKMNAAQHKLDISMNRDRLLPDAKSLCSNLAKNYYPPKSKILKIPTASVRKVFEEKIEERSNEYEREVLKHLAYVLSGGKANGVVVGRMDKDNPDHEIEERQLMDLEHDAFLSLIKNKETQIKIEEAIK